MGLRGGRIVEFTGAPGAGKSTVAAHCALLLEARGLRIPPRQAVRDLYLRHGWVGRLAGPQVREREVAGQRLEYFKEVETPFLLWRFRARHRRGWRLFRAELEGLRAADAEEAETLERWVEQSILTYMMLRSQARRMDLFLWEEGIAHRSVNLFADPERPLDPGRLDAFLRAWVFPDALVHVQAEPEDCLARVAARGLPARLQDRGPDAVRAFLERGAAVCRAIAAEARRRRIPTFDLENRHGSVEALAASPACRTLADDLVRALRAGPRSAA